MVECNAVDYMPELKTHEEDSLKKYGKKFTELHQWMDEPVKIMGRKHRKYRHDPNITPIEAKRMFGENADNACLDHIILDTEEYLKLKGEKNTKSTSLSNQMSLRIPNEMMRIIFDYTKQSNKKNLTETILYFMRRGMITQSLTEKTGRFLNEQEKWMMNAIKNNRPVGTNILTRTLERDNYTCRKCGSTKDIMEIDLPLGLTDRTFSGLGCESSITLCKECKNRFDVYIPKRYGLERFIEWYYGE